MIICYLKFKSIVICIFKEIVICTKIINTCTRSQNTFIGSHSLYISSQLFRQRYKGGFQNPTSLSSQSLHLISSQFYNFSLKTHRSAPMADSRHTLPQVSSLTSLTVFSLRKNHSLHIQNSQAFSVSDLNLNLTSTS